jgi:hypothetical protein
MKNRNRAWGIGLVVWGTLAACSPDVHELGDEPLAGSGGSGGSGKGGSGSILPKGGSNTTPTAGAGSTFQNVAGAAPQPEECFSPTHSPNLALIDPDEGCACVDEPPECVETEHEGRPWRVSLYCERGQWTTGEDGVCGDGGQADCHVDGVTYAHGARRVPAPFSACNTCVCNDGNLSECTGNECADRTCEQGSYRAKRCVECGPVDQCLEVETGCLSGPGCESGFCEEGRCG